jgi:hypothetical protein
VIEATEDVLVAICIVIIQVGFQIEYEWALTLEHTECYGRRCAITEHH